MSFSTGWIIFYVLVFPGFLFTSLVGLTYTWLDRKLTARVQFRVGPPFLQPFYDFFKLLGKDTFIPEGAPRSIFLGVPLFALAGVSLISTILLLANIIPGYAFAGDVIVVLYLFAFVPLALILGASSTGNPISALGASREMTLYLAYELPLLFALATVIVKSGGMIKIGDLLQWQWNNHPFLYSLSGAIAFITALMCMQAKMGFVPFDIADAEQEIMSGVMIEYSGPPLGVFKLIKGMLYFSVSIFMVIIFWGGFRMPTKEHWWHIFGWLKPLAVLLLMVLIKNTNPRLRIDQAVKFFWSIMLVTSILGFILATVGL